MSDTTAVGQGSLGLPVSMGVVGSSTTTTTPSEPLASTSGAFGVVEGDPVWWVGVQVGSEVSKVSVKFSDGSTDEMIPVTGVAALAHHVSSSTVSANPYEVTGVVQFLDASGAVIATEALPAPTATPEPLPAPTPGSVGSGSGGSAGSGHSGTTIFNGNSAPSAESIVACPMIPAPIQPQ